MSTRVTTRERGNDTLQFLSRQGPKKRVRKGTAAGWGVGGAGRDSRGNGGRGGAAIRIGGTIIHRQICGRGKVGAIIAERRVRNVATTVEVTPKGEGRRQGTRQNTRISPEDANREGSTEEAGEYPSGKLSKDRRSSRWR